MDTSSRTRQANPPAPLYVDLIRRGASQHGPRIAVQFGSQELSFRQVDALSNQLAQALAFAGAGPHSRVAILLNNGIYSVPVDFACVKAGINRVPLNARLSLAEHARMLAETQAMFLLFGTDLAERARELKEQVPALQCFGLGPDGPQAAWPAGAADLLTLAQAQPDTEPDVAHQPGDVILTLFTSGTTGTLKAAQHTQASYAGICRNVLLNLFPATRDDVMLHAASLIHASGVFVLPCWLRGARTAILPGFDPQTYLDSIHHHGATAINLVPTMLQMLLAQPGSATPPASLQRVIYGASPMPDAVIRKAMAAWGQHRFWQYYGQTEAPLCIAVLRPEDHAGETLGACGQPCVDVEIRLLDDQGQHVPQGEAGEICIRSASAIAGYFNADELNAQTFSTDGWVHTRDIGCFDARGFLYIKDRTSDMIISGGYNIYPSEVENALLTHPAVAEVAVIGLPHEKWVEEVVACVVRRNGAEVGESELVAHVQARLASYKKPGRILWLDAIPKTAVGKINRKALRDQWRGMR
ncbi:long-chain fatty acid--CoA ligase [Corticibacter populi]|uniref:Long-chain fatty acid--CoA ligase n=1 Tax=Corticibacter populi TaxID=1550736 RepID=A0A3M6QSK6_9BURK|nr:AMP-binding protein [Corticibacter populi]RMX06014.1 long-chain fatty acid--CoA ligase [Corticibacter populi]RZS31073.1 acyl-CoA synthetase (AMP-forming)/AMP-acid ligase II [Corticibacter populi]